MSVATISVSGCKHGVIQRCGHYRGGDEQRRHREIGPRKADESPP
ncbi:hypothetical protein [Microbacterium elymi]|uniref:Uncharacterized protein n=1 Tax=Microbacterium elymi TaxID=2909587 RepID=A0ABY5NI89_9MICO|nr:hypothetical protein [Microbacterium elymi]UUT34909.1 hypothetical protein L2X98_31420 [Microbacterium elymi]